jgi:hypothetical protein
VDVWRFQKAYVELKRAHPRASEKNIQAAARRQAQSEEVDDDLSRLDSQVFGDDYAGQAGRLDPVGERDPVDAFNVPELQQGYRIEKKRHPDWTHHHLVNLVLMRIAQDPDAYSKARRAAERRSRTPQRYDACRTCEFYNSFLDNSLRAGNCGHPKQLGKTVREESICENWKPKM